MPRSRSGAGVLVVTLIFGLLAALVLSAILRQFIPEESVVFQVLLNGYVYEAGPYLINFIVATFTIGFSVTINLLAILGMVAAFYYWKHRT